MQIVIEVDDDLYTRLFDNGTDFYDTDDILAMAKAIRKGKVLPKGHGRLIDYGYVVDAIDDWINAGEYNYTNATDYLRKRVSNTPAIIEADRAERIDKC